VIEVEGVTLAYPARRVLDDIHLAIASGEFVGLLGPNGAGKTSLIGTVCGLIAPTAGRVRVAGLDPVRERTLAARQIGLVPQDLAFSHALTAWQNLAFFGRVQGLWGPTLRRAVGRVLEVVQLVDRADDRAGEFSGGMQRRLNVAIGLLHEPALLVLDEPTTGVDAQSRSALLDCFEAIGAAGTTVLYSTHLMEEAQRLCHRVAIMDEGRIVADDEPDALVERYAGGRLRVGFDRPPPEALGAALASEGIARAARREARELELMVGRPEPALVALVDRAAALGLSIESIDLPEPSLESVYLHLTGKRLRDPGADSP
jgi:ABC-2 type transport system ATP-binding protein